MKKLLLLGFLSITSSAFAQNVFWSFDDAQEPLTIAPECDAKFDEIQGGVFMPKLEEVYEHGLLFLQNSAPEIQRQAPYCFLVAAFGGNHEAQFKLAQLYNEGKILPKDDLSSYKWAFISALNGNKAAEKFTLNLEQFLTTEDLQATTTAIQDARLKILENMKTELKELQEKQQSPKEEIAESAPKSKPRANGLRAPLPTKMTEIFSEEDHF